MSSGRVATPSDGYFRLDGLDLHYGEWEDPSRETLVLVHGNRDQARSWDFFVDALYAREAFPFHVVALDLRGHGDSAWSPAERDYRHEDFLLDLAAMVRHLKKDSVTLIGHSLGGSIATLFAGSFPARIKRLVLIEAAGPHARPEGDVPKLLARWLDGEASRAEPSLYRTPDEAGAAIRTRFPMIPDRARAHMVRHGTKRTGQGYVWKYDPRLRFPSFSTFTEGQVRAFIERIHCPALLIFGSEGGFMESPRFARVGLFRTGRVVEIEGSGHHVPHEKPAELAETVSAFLRP